MATKRIFDEFLSNKEWLIEQKGYYKPLQQVREAHFALGNGIIGSRGILECLPYDANAGTYIAGIYDRFGAQITELVNFPNPIVFRVDVSGEKLDPRAMDTLEHYRALDMKKGLLVRHTVYKTAHNKRIDYQSYRFLSMYQKFVGSMVVSITPLDSDMTFNINAMIDTSVCNRGVLTEGRKRHFEVTEISTGKKYNYTEVKTFEHQHLLGYATCLEIEKKNRKFTKVDYTFNIKIKKGERVTFIKYFSIVPSFYAKTKRIKKIAMQELRRGRKLGAKRLLNASENAWEKLWNVSDIIMEDSVIRQKAVRFNIYHLLIAGNNDNRSSIGARSLSGEGYRGHIFWDAETFILPFFIFTNPPIAKSMLMYRYDRLDHAKKIAAAKRYEGALFPWESADTGEETTPSWFKDLVGEVLKIETLEEEHHIVADIAYAVNQYTEASGDLNFMANCGLEILIETARFWVSRVKYNKKMRRYEMHNVMGPDEFHKDTDNNAFTSEMARFNIQLAMKWFVWAKKNNPKSLEKLKKKTGLTDHEIKKSKAICDKIYIPFSKKRKIIEQFDGYLRLKDAHIRELDQHFMPIVPPEAQPPEDGETQLIKQSDVVMLTYLLCSKYSLDEISLNLKYYEKRTLHKSSLSPSIHSIVSARTGDVDRALHYLTVAINSDLLDIHKNASEGFHAASGGGAWQTMIMGFGGLQLMPDRLIFTPRLPNVWKSLSFKIFWRSALISIKIKRNEMEFKRLNAGRKGRFTIEVNGVQKELPIRKWIRFGV